jgi:hypothetical protein
VRVTLTTVIAALLGGLIGAALIARFFWVALAAAREHAASLSEEFALRGVEFVHWRDASTKMTTALIKAAAAQHEAEVARKAAWKLVGEAWAMRREMVEAEIRTSVAEGFTRAVVRQPALEPGLAKVAAAPRKAIRRPRDRPRKKN